jgi:hypothetical protein
MPKMLGPHVTESRGSFLQVQIDGGTDVCRCENGLMANHISSHDVWDLRSGREHRRRHDGRRAVGRDRRELIAADPGVAHGAGSGHADNMSSSVVG